MPDRDETTLLLRNAAQGDRRASEDLARRVYEELHEQAVRLMRRERPDHTLQPTALADEAFMRLVDGAKVDWKCRSHFMALAARSMRQILVNYAHEHGAQKRGGGRKRVPIDEADFSAGSTEIEFIALDESLKELARLDARQAKVTELKFFGNLTFEEIGAMLGISARTAKEDWRFAKAWLAVRLTD